MIKPLTNNGKLVVSLTSFPARINNVWRVIQSLFEQSIQPDNIVLYLYSEEFPNRLNDLPDNLSFYIKLGLQVRFVEFNYRSHLKYYYAFSDFENSDIITVDDDIYYAPSLVENLLGISEKHKDCVCSSLVREITTSKEEVIGSYCEWRRYPKFNTESLHYLALGYGGVLYPKTSRCFYDYKNLSFIELALEADDLWLKSQQLLSNIPVATGEKIGEPFYLNSSNDMPLSAENTGDSARNDIIMERIIKFYGESLNLKKYKNDAKISKNSF